MLMREAPAQAEALDAALRRSARTGNETAVVGPAHGADWRSVVEEGEPTGVTPNARDRTLSLQRQTDSPIVDFHTHPSSTTSDALFVINPSARDFDYWGTSYPTRRLRDRELRTVVAAPPRSGPSGRTGSGYAFFATDRPEFEFDTQRLSDAVLQLQSDAARGRLDKLRLHPRFGDYFDYGGEIADIAEAAAPLSLMRLAQEAGRGRFEAVVPRGRSLTPDPETTLDRLYAELLPLTVERLRAAKFQRGGLARLKECSCNG